MMYDLQKANVFKRASAFLFDVILLSVAAVGFAFIISAITGYDVQSRRLDGRSKLHQYDPGRGCG